MTDTLSKRERSKRMSLIRGRDTRLELSVRSITHKMGFRYRLHKSGLPGKPDMVFPGRKKIIFIHGCFWHRHESANCKLARLPKSKLDFWRPKLEGNKLRDQSNERKLQELGWQVLTVWECETGDRIVLAEKIRRFLDG
jgi:DNA mismatch endonuclease (patch repair protein)